MRTRLGASADAWRRPVARWRWRPMAGSRPACRRRHHRCSGFLGCRRISAPPCRIYDARTLSSGASSAWWIFSAWCRRRFPISKLRSRCRRLSPPGDGPAKHTKSPVASIKAERPLALIIIWQSPHLPVPGRNETPRRVRSGAKKGNLRAESGRKQGKHAAAKRGYAGLPAGRICDPEPCGCGPGQIDVMSLRRSGLRLRFPKRMRSLQRRRLQITTS